MSKQRDAYVEKCKAQLDQLNAKVDLLQANAKEAGADARIKYEQELDQIREKREATRSKLDELQSASEDAWQDVKAGFERSWNAFSESVKRAVQRFD